MPKKTSQPDRLSGPNLILLLILLLGLALRVWGIFWSLPQGVGFSHHPDEALQVIAASRIDFASFRLDPQFYNYGAMYMYIVSAASSLFSAAGLMDPASMAARYLIARLVTVLLGAAIPYFVYLIGLRLYDRRIGLFAAGVAAITPIAVQHSHFATVDIPATFWVAACLAASARIFRKATIGACIAAGLCAGFAGATKYTTAVVLIAPLAALIGGAWQLPRERKLGITPWIIGGGIIGFVIGNPGCILWSGEFWKAFSYELGHSQSGHGLVFINTGLGLFFHLTSSLHYGLGVSYLVIALIGLVLMAVDRGRHGWFLFAFAVVYYLLISSSQVRFARYIIPLTPVLAIAFTVAVAAGFNCVTRLRRGTARFRQTMCALWLVVVVGVVYYTACYTIALDRLFVVKPSTVAAAEWIDRHAPAGSTIAFPTIPWFYSPDLSPGFTEVLPQKRYEAMLAVKKYHLVTNPNQEWDSTPLLSKTTDCVIISDYEDLDAVRAWYQPATDYVRLARGYYPSIRIISERLQAGGLDFGPAEQLPHDMKYTSPRITIYQRRSDTSKSFAQKQRLCCGNGLDDLSHGVGRASSRSLAVSVTPPAAGIALDEITDIRCSRPFPQHTLYPLASTSCRERRA